MSAHQLLDAAGRPRSPATMPGHHAGRVPRAATSPAYPTSRSNPMDNPHERRRHAGCPEICRRQPASEVISQRSVHIQKSDAPLCDNPVIGSGRG
jgi:hypothetical protein